MEKQLRKLRVLTKMALDVEMMKLQRAASAEAEKADQIENLRASQTERTATLSEKGGTDFAHYGGADQRWAVWNQRKISDLNTQRAALIAARDGQKLQTQKAFGKDESVRRLVDDARETARVTRSRV